MLCFHWFFFFLCLLVCDVMHYIVHYGRLVLPVCVLDRIMYHQSTGSYRLAQEGTTVSPPHNRPQGPPHPAPDSLVPSLAASLFEGMVVFGVCAVGERKGRQPPTAGSISSLTSNANANVGLGRIGQELQALQSHDGRPEPRTLDGAELED